MKIKQIDGRIERKQKLLSPAYGYVMTKKMYIATKALVATKEVLVSMKKKNGKCHSLGYVLTKVLVATKTPLSR